MRKVFLLVSFIVFVFAKSFSVSYDPDYAPFCYGENPQGILIDIWKLWGKKNGYDIKFVNGKTWENAIQLAKDGKVDFFIGTDPYEDWMKASQVFYKIKTGLFVDDNFYKKIHIIGIIGEDYKEELLNHFRDNKYNNIFENSIEIKSYSTYEELFKALKNKQVEAIYDDYLALVYFAIQHQYMFIKQVPEFSLSSYVKAISNSETNIKIFNEGLKNITSSELQMIEDKWNIHLSKETKYMKYFIIVILMIVFIMLIFIVINNKLKKAVIQKTKDLAELNAKLEDEIKQRTKELELKTIEAEKSAKAKASFLANMSHEIRTPLNSIIGFTSLLKEEELTSSARNYVNIIEKSSKSLLGIINDILDFSKIEEGKLSIEKIAFNLDEEIENIAQMFYPKANEKNIVFKVNQQNTDVYIKTDSTRLKQVILNLLSNAFKFTDEGKTIELFVKFENNEIFVSVKDEGIGIAKDKLEHIFEDFSQADTSTTRKYGGTGLGLSISSSLVKLLGGELKVKSEVNKGSEFYFSIPASKTTPQKKEEKIVKSQQFDHYVLLVEDNKANQMFMSVILKKLGIKFDIANDGVEAVEMYKKYHNKYDLILMDENMPNMTGRVATREIRKFEKENNLKSIFIVALTANALTGDKEKFIEAGMNDYLSKPLNIEKLISIFRKMV